MQFSEHVKVRREKFGTVIFDTLTEKIFITNETGRDILQLIEQGEDIPAILYQLKNSYEANAGLIEKDLDVFIGNLKLNQFIK